METFLIILKYVGAPLLGALIGCFTNWLAVKMLFRPYYPKRIGKWQLPFTPGIIPKRKGALAKAVGRAVGEQLFTKDDLATAVISNDAKKKIADYAVGLWHSAGEKTADELVNKAVPAEKREDIIRAAENFVTDKIYNSVSEMNLGKIVAEEGVKAVNSKKATLGMLAMFLSDELVRSVADKLSDGVNAYVATNGRQLIYNSVKSEIEKALNAPLSAITAKVDENAVREAACTAYEKVIKAAFAEFTKSLDVCAVVEQKINDMDVKELEKLVLSVMKKELNAIVWLGALIGLILGIIMIFV